LPYITDNILEILMDFEIVFIPEAKKEFEKLDRSIKQLVADKINKLKNNPHIGEPLGNKIGRNLTGYYKIYVFNKKIRIVYEIIDKILIVKIITISKREKFEAYFLADKRKS
jgi:mRNA interferase RelE/StbE